MRTAITGWRRDLFPNYFRQYSSCCCCCCMRRQLAHFAYICPCGRGVLVSISPARYVAIKSFTLTWLHTASRWLCTTTSVIDEASRGETIYPSIFPPMTVRRGHRLSMVKPHGQCFGSGAGDGLVVVSATFGGYWLNSTGAVSTLLPRKILVTHSIRILLSS